MSLITKMRKQTAVWWSRNGTDRYGASKYAAPVEVACRWEDTLSEFLGANGEKQTSSAVVYVDREMEVGDRLFRGALESDTPADPTQQEGSQVIMRFDRLPNLKNTENLLTCYL